MSANKTLLRLVQLLSGVFCLLLLPVYSVETTPSLTGSSSNSLSPGFFMFTHPTLPSHYLNFNNSLNQSCCTTNNGLPVQKASMAKSPAQNPALWNEFEQDNPHHVVHTMPVPVVTCNRFEQFPELVSNAAMPANLGPRDPKKLGLPLESYSTSISLREGAQYITHPQTDMTSDFHVETAGGAAQVQLQGVKSYSVCMARGNNVAMISNSNQASILTYNGSDHVYLAGNNTNMLTRTGAGEDLIELYQAHPKDKTVAAITPETEWSAYNIYKSAISGGTGMDTLLLKSTPPGSKWCNIGKYTFLGESFHVVEFALPPTVTEGPRRQRINIGDSVEFVVLNSKKYTLANFLAHGSPMDAIARSVALHEALPEVKTASLKLSSGFFRIPLTWPD
jgi:hypothetical protein